MKSFLRYEMKCLESGKFPSVRMLYCRHLNSSANKACNSAPIQINHVELACNIDAQILKQNLISDLHASSTKYLDLIDSKCINALPVFLAQDQINHLTQIQEAIFNSIKIVVENYHNDPTIQSAFNFSDRVKAILKCCKEFSYENRLGSYRPDFLHEKHTNKVRVCEINARFPLNGYLTTLFALKNGNKYTTSFKQMSDNQIEAVDFGDLLFEKLSNYFDLSKPIGILKRKERGYDINMIKDFLQQTNIHFIDPDNLQVDKSLNKIRAFLHDNQKEEILLDQFIFELHQDEIISMLPQTLHFMIEKCKILNDLRTIFLGHDKRLMTLLCRPKFLEQYFTQKHANTLRNSLVYTILGSDLNKDNRLKENLIEQKNKWLIKPCLFGKGEGILFGKNLCSSEWKALLNHVSSSNEFVLQEYVEQEKFELLNCQNTFSYYNLVGTLLCFDNRFLGAGVYRASNKDLISLSQGGFIMFPIRSAESKHSSLNQQQPDLAFNIEEKNQLIRTEKIDLIKSLLTENGLVFIDLNFVDNESEFLLNLIQKMDMIPYAHSIKGNDYVWHIRPLNRVEFFASRSQTNKEFCLHTDASFESVPPRFFALQVLEHDRFNGGKSLFIKFDDVLSKMTRKEIELLSTTRVKIRIPDEFRKNNSSSNFIYASLFSRDTDLSAHRLVRYRSDILLNEDMNLGEEFRGALNKFESLIDLKTSRLVKMIELKRNQVILVDNSRFLHGRTKILDKKRHLIRIRFQTKDKNYLPWNFS